jgi:hypothetical protein
MIIIVQSEYNDSESIAQSLHTLMEVSDLLEFIEHCCCYIFRAINIVEESFQEKK